MSVLGIDTATADTVAGVCAVGGEPFSELTEGPAPNGRPRHASALLPLVERAVQDAGGWESIGRIAVGIGPGSFTGIRVGVATARALAQARGLELAPVRSSAALAAGVAEASADSGLAVLDARRGEVFAEAAGGERAAASDRGGSADPPAGPVLLAPTAVGAAFAGLAGAMAAGEGAIRFRGELEAVGFAVPPDRDPAHRLSARYVCRLGAAAESGGIDDVRPLYLREPDAERWLERD